MSCEHCEHCRALRDAATVPCQFGQYFSRSCGTCVTRSDHLVVESRFQYAGRVKVVVCRDCADKVVDARWGAVVSDDGRTFNKALDESKR